MSSDPCPEVLALPSTAQAPAIARDHVRRLGVRWPPDTLETVLLLVSEAVTNAVRYGHGDVDLAVQAETGNIRVEVGDANPRPPHKRELHGGLVEGGQGLYLIDALTSSWGTRPRADRAGKTVWLDVIAS